MGASCCQSNQQKEINEEISVESADFNRDNRSPGNALVKQETGAQKRNQFIPAQTFGIALKKQNNNNVVHSDDSSGKERYHPEQNLEEVKLQENKQSSLNDMKGSDKKIQFEQQQSQQKVKIITKKKIKQNQSMEMNGYHPKIEMKVGVDSFIQLKKGSITDFYDTGEVLGEGAYGKVCKVTHRTTKIMRAMKSIKKASILKEDQEKLFSEMNILKNLDHPNIVKLYELFEDARNYYLITEYCSGGELFDRIKSLNYFSEKKAADLMRQILMAVVYCHGQSIVHRDLKPENLLFVSKDPDSKLKVIDFGTSRKFDNKKRMTKRLGTPYYIAPEVLLENYNEKCDIWSCGVILYILLCGYPPFSGRSEEDILTRVKAGRFKFDPEDWDHISLEAKSLIQKMLTLNPSKRITAEQALNDSWIQINAPNVELNQKSLQQLQQFQARSKFKQALLTFIATQILTQQEQEELQKAFQAIDSNGDGMLSREELINGYVQVSKNRQEAEEKVDNIMDLVDINKSGKVDFTEFIIAAMNQEKLLSVEKVKQAFIIIDLDGDKYISKAELEYTMGGLDEAIWQQILSECDNDNDGKISLEEFGALLLSKVM